MDKYINAKRLADLSTSETTRHNSDSDDNAEPPSKKTAGTTTSKRLCRRYDDAYLKYGFIACGDKPQCVICLEVLANASMKPSKLLRHQQTKHKDTVGKPFLFFQRKSCEVRKQTGTFRKLTTLNCDSLKAICI